MRKNIDIIKNKLYRQSSIIGIISKIFLFVSLSAILISSIAGSLLTSGDTDVAVIVLSTLASLFGVLTVFLLANRNYNGYIFGVIQVILLGVVSVFWSLWGQVFLNFFVYLLANISGFFLWKKHREDEYITKKETMSFKLLSSLIVAVILIALAFSFTLKYTNSNDPYPFIDGFITVFALLGTYLMVKRYDTQWLIWIIVNILTVSLYSVYYHDTHSVEYIPQIVMWIFTTFNSIYGFIIWRSPLKTKILSVERNLSTNNKFGRFTGVKYGAVTFNGYKNTNYRNIKINHNIKLLKNEFNFKVLFGSKKNVELKLISYKYKTKKYKPKEYNMKHYYDWY